MPTQEEKSRVNVHGTTFDLSQRPGSQKRSAKDVQILAEAAILKHLEGDDALEALKTQLEQIRKEAQCEHSKADWRLMIGSPRGSGSSSVSRTVRCVCTRCGKVLFEKTGEEVQHA